MVLDTTYKNEEYKDLINDVIGKPYSLVQSFKIGGIGSKRMIIDKASLNFKSLMNTVSDINYANIELRPNGILIYINKGLKNFTWVIPYYQLIIYKTNGMSIHAQGHYLHFRDNITYRENKKFLNKLFSLKIQNTIDHSLN